MHSPSPMPKKKRTAFLLLKKDGVLVRQLEIHGQRTTIGRKPGNDLIVDLPSVSGEHAVINRTSVQYFYEDLNSTNGSSINGERVDYGMLYDGDVIEFGSYVIEFSEQDRVPPVHNPVPPQISAMLDLREAPPPLAAIPPAASPAALVRIVTGASAGKEWILTKSLTTIGTPPQHVAVFMRLPDAYALAHVDGGTETTVNGIPIYQQRQLVHGDVIGIGKSEAIFFLDPWYAHR